MERSSRRWLIVAALFAITYAMSTPLAAFGVFLPVLAEEFGWSRGAISMALSINLLLGGIAGFALGALADRYGPRIILVLTVVTAGAAFALVGVVDALWQLYLFAGVLGGIGMSSFYVLSATTVSQWFGARRGLALGLVLMGFNLGYISTGPLAPWLIARTGWRVAYALLGVGSGLIGLAAALTVRRPRSAAGERPALGGRDGRAAPDLPAGAERGVTLREALADPHQWYLNLAWLLSGGLAFMVTVHVVSFARDQGLGLAAASLGITAYGVGSVSGRVVAGALADRIGSMPAMRAAYALQLLALIALIWWPSRVGLLVSLTAFGLGFAAADTVSVKVFSEVFGPRALGAIIGVLTLGWRFGAALGPAAAGFVHDLTGSYRMAFDAAPVVLLASWAFFALGTSRRAS